MLFSRNYPNMIDIISKATKYSISHRREVKIKKKRTWRYGGVVLSCTWGSGRGRQRDREGLSDDVTAERYDRSKGKKSQDHLGEVSSKQRNS